MTDESQLILTAITFVTAILDQKFHIYILHLSITTSASKETTRKQFYPAKSARKLSLNVFSIYY